MRDANLNKSIKYLKDLIIPFENDIREKLKDNFDPLECLIHLWSSSNENEFKLLFKEKIENTKLERIIEILQQIYDWKLIDNQYDPEKDILQKNTMDYALKNLINFMEKDEILDICSGFFRPKVWELIGNDFQQLYGLRLLIGAEYEIPKDSTERIQKIFQELLKDETKTHLEKSYSTHRMVIEDTSIDDWDLTTSIINLLEFLKKDTVDVRLQKFPFQHGKLYLLNNVAYLGSSNFTFSGLTNNTELNVQIQDKRLIKKLTNWYEKQYEQATPYKEILIDLIERSKFGNHPYSPFEVYMKIAFEQYKEDFVKIIEEGKIQLAQFQAEGASKAISAIKKFGGVMIADAVGLGKSFTAMAILENLKFYRGLVICPAQLRARWSGYMENFPACRVFSMEEMSLDLPRKQDSTPMDYDVILIDESHNFRTIGTKRHNNLLTLLEHCSNSKLILVTATPINTSLNDLYHQLMLICGRGQGFPSLGIQNLKEYFKKIEKDETAIDLIKQNLLVAHSRAMIRNRQKVHHVDIMLPNNTLIEFPERTLNTIRYSIIPMSEKQEREYQEKFELWKQSQVEINNNASNTSIQRNNIKKPQTPSEEYYVFVFDTLDHLNLVPFNLERYKKEEFQDDQINIRNRGIVAMLRTMLLKRMESSIYSFMDSLEIQLKLCEVFENLLAKGFVATSEFIRRVEKLIEKSEYEDSDEIEDTESNFQNLIQFIENILPETLDKMRIKKLSQAELEKRTDDEIFYKYLKKIEINEYNDNYKEQMISDVLKDKDKLQIIYNKTKQIYENGDLKLEKLKETLNEIYSIAKNYDERKIIIFSYFRTTAEYIYNELINDEKWKEKNSNPIIEMITGRTPSIRRLDLVERFAPKSSILDLQGESKVKKQKELENKEELELLICTDVLSEGQNLQDGRSVINYDLHWNPVKLIQRSGRIDRLGCIHKEVGIFNFFPQTGLEKLINLVERIRRRLSTIDETVGLDADMMDLGDARTRRLYEEEMKKREEEESRRIDLFKIENENVKILDDFEERMEVGGDDIAKIKLFGEIKKQGFEYYQNEVPLGIHSGLVNLQYSGLIIVVSIIKDEVEQLYWMFWSEDDDFRERFSHTYGLLINKPKVERMLNNVVSEWDEIKRAKFPDEIRHLSESPQDLFKKVIEIVQNFKKYMSKKDKLDKINAKKPIKGNGVYLQFIERAIQNRVISREYSNRFIELLFEKSIIDLAKEETVAEIIEEFKTTQKAIEEKTRNSKIDALEKEEKIKNLYEKGAKDLLVKFYNYMDITGIDVKKRRESKLEDENLKLVGFIRLYKLNNMDNF